MPRTASTCGRPSFNSARAKRPAIHVQHSSSTTDLDADLMAIS
ncbi:hypothetical protein [Nostoc sp. UHCC 0252]|nr:hypothetical protein [Nostoc sp. UHCC 0252]MEA5600447.1 hypothetical protein [Nostoc sp. UHCC 0252]